MKTTPMRTNESAAGSTRLLHRLTAALLALVLAASAALPVFAADTAPTDTIYINSVSDLLAFADKCGFDQWSKGKTVICLLYTSPSPRDGLLSRMPSSA